MSVIWLEEEVQSPDVKWDADYVKPVFLGRIVRRKLKESPYVQGCYIDHQNRKLIVSIFPAGRILLGTPGHPVQLEDADQLVDIEESIQELVRKTEEMFEKKG